MDWLQRITTAIAEATGVDAAAIALPPGARGALLDVARVASHTTGDRTNAPLLCYVLGVAAGRGVPLERAIEVVGREAQGN